MRTGCAAVVVNKPSLIHYSCGPAELDGRVQEARQQAQRPEPAEEHQLLVSQLQDAHSRAQAAIEATLTSIEGTPRHASYTVSVSETLSSPELRAR